MPPTGKDRSRFRLRALNGEKVAFPLEGFGWRFGSFNKEGIALPDGVVAYFWNFALVISELGLRAEEGATYLVVLGRAADRAAERPRGRPDRQAAALPRCRQRVTPGHEARRLLPPCAQP